MGKIQKLETMKSAFALCCIALLAFSAAEMRPAKIISDIDMFQMEQLEEAAKTKYTVLLDLEDTPAATVPSVFGTFTSLADGTGYAPHPGAHVASHNGVIASTTGS